MEKTCDNCLEQSFCLILLFHEVARKFDDELKEIENCIGWRDTPTEAERIRNKGW